MARSISELARAAMKVCEDLEGFSATETVSAGPIKAEGRIRYRRPGKITLEYRTYEDSLAEFEEKLAGSEFIPEELLGMQIVHDGRGTWLYDVKRNVALRKLGRRLYSPLRLPDGIAEIGFMCHLTRDFLLRDEGQEEINGKKARKIGLKPKTQERMSLFKDEVFSLKRAILSIDPETLFPMRILFYPSQRSPLYYIAGPSTPITIDYKDVLFAVPNEDLFSFTPAEETRVFNEEEVGEKALADKLPFALPFDQITQRGYKLYNDRITVTANESRERAYVFLSFEKKQASSKQITGISLRVGNYLSPNMNRRRALLADSGEEIDLGGAKGRIIDRSALLKDEIPESVRRSLIEMGWQDGDVHWFLLGEGLNRDDLVGIATAMVSSDIVSSNDEADQSEE
ncbi:MAG TPA: hypothetical protein ENH11_05215 [Candidatus Acetothermia bacterium]|nr:hypothetical protein [Candidatus Acetothermia bacterium]